MKPNYPYNELEKHLCLMLGFKGSEIITYTVVYQHPELYEDYDYAEVWDQLTVVTGGLKTGLRDILIDPIKKQIVLDGLVVYNIDKISIAIEGIDFALDATPLDEFVEHLDNNEVIANCLFSYNLDCICTPEFEYTKPANKYNICDN